MPSNWFPEPSALNSHITKRWWGYLLSDTSKFKLLAAFRHIGQKINLSDFDARLVFQKQVYLLQELGLKLGHSYGWYRRGPYSSEAAADGFQLEPIQDNVENLPELTQDELKAAETLQDLVSESAGRFTSDDKAYCMELLGSLHFVLKHGYPRSASKEDALRRFKELKPKFGEDSEVALELLDQKNLI
jgi:hypothetical protein